MADTALEKRVSMLEEMVEDVPRLVNLRFSFLRSQIEALDARVGAVDAKVDRMVGQLAALEAKVDTLPRVFAEVLDERDRRKDRK